MRNKPPARRESTNVSLAFGGMEYVCSYARRPDGHIAEVFLWGPKVGSDLYYIVFSAGIALSLAFQHGATPEEISHACLRHPDGSPTDIVGAVCDMLIRESHD